MIPNLTCLLISLPELVGMDPLCGRLQSGGE